MALLWFVLGGLALVGVGLAWWGWAQGRQRRREGIRRPPDRPVQARDGAWVASRGEKRIADWLSARGIAYRYEPEMAGGLTPDFHVEGTDVVIEYWGMAGQPSYEERMVEKIERYEAHGLEVVSVFPMHVREMGDVLERELRERGILPGDGPRNPGGPREDRNP